MPRPSPDPRDSSPDRPPLWVDGRQQPRFDLRAWLWVGQAMARLWLVPQLARASAMAQALGGQIAGGRFRIKLSWLGKAERFVPSRAAVSGSILALSARLSEARLILAPAPEAPEPIAYPDLMTSAPVARTAPPAAHPADAAEPTLSAIRAILRDLPEPEPPRPVRPAPLAPAAPASAGPLRQHLARALAHLIAWTALALSLPVGLTQAALYHLDGGDLADWD